MEGSFLGPAFAQAEIKDRLANAGAVFTVVSDADAIESTASSLADLQKTLNLRVKYRESFRPFPPAVLREDLADWFELDDDSPYMLLVADVKHERRRRMTNEEEQLFGIDKLNVVRSEIPAVTEVDYSGRVQKVHVDTNPRFHTLIERRDIMLGR